MPNIDEVLSKRFYSRLNTISFKELGLKEVYVAGNCLNRLSPHDIDVFPVNEDDFIGLKSKLKPIVFTKNALTVKINNITVQFCNYHHNSLVELVDSFDFAHIKLGVHVVNDCIEDIYISEDYKDARIIESTYYTKSDYPLSSLIRLYKYHKRGDLAGKSYMIETLKIMTDIVERGFEDYEDFKDQLDAIDLGLVPEDVAELETANLLKLFELLRKDK